MYPALGTQKFGLYSNGHCMTCGHPYKLESYMQSDVQITMITVVPFWAKSGLRSNLRHATETRHIGQLYMSMITQNYDTLTTA